MKTLRGILLFEMLPVLVVMAGAATAYHLHGRQAALRNAEDRLDSAARLTAELVHRELAPLAETLRSLMMQRSVAEYLHAGRTAQPERSARAREQIERALEHAVTQNSRIDAIGLYTVSGQQIASLGAPDAGATQAHRKPWFPQTPKVERHFRFEGRERLRLVTSTSRSSRSGPPVIATLVYDFPSTLREAAQLATRGLDEVEVLLTTSGGETRQVYGGLASSFPPLEARVSLGDAGSAIVVRQSRSAALASFRQGQSALLIPLAAVTLGLLLVAALGTQKITRDLREAQRHTEEANAAKSEFLAHMSHEIRTPMNGILGMLELLQTARLKPQEREYLDMARDSADSLLRLLNDILDFSKIEAGRLELEEAPFDVRQLIQGTLQTLSLRAAQKGLRFSVLVDEAVPAALIGDAGRLRQILVNLVGNAIKFTAEGQIEITVRPDPDEHIPCGFPPPAGTAEPAREAPCGSPEASSTCGLRFTVRDTGVGVPADKRQQIFEAFRQADRSTSRRFGGTGLGLAIASELVHMMHGRLWLDDGPEPGSTFHFALRLPVAELSATRLTAALPRTSRPTAEALPPPVRSARILLAEDGLISQKVAVRLLERRGHSVFVAENGQQVLEALRHQAFDLILMDVEMPEMDGLEATRAIRAQEDSTGWRIPIVALTAHSIKGDRERFLAAGMDDYLAKPVSSRTLYEVVERNMPGIVCDAPQLDLSASCI